MSGSQHPKVRGRVWDPLVRLFHWSLAVAFAVAWFERSDAAIHNSAGKFVLVLIIFRAAWGLIGPASARFETFIRGPKATATYLISILRRNPQHHLGHNPAGGAMIGVLLLALTVTAASGILMNTTALWGDAWTEWIHGTAATVSVWLIAGHLAGVLIACLQHRENLPLAMITGRKSVPPGTNRYLGHARLALSLRRFAGALLLVCFSATAWIGSEILLNASMWRMNKIVAAAVTKHGCEVADISGPRVELYPDVKFRFDLTLVGHDKPAEAAIPVEIAMLRRPVVPLDVFAKLCAQVVVKASPQDVVTPAAATEELTQN